MPNIWSTTKRGGIALPLPKRHFRPEVAAHTYEEHLEAWALMDALGFDGVGFQVTKVPV